MGRRGRVTKHGDREGGGEGDKEVTCMQPKSLQRFTIIATSAHHPIRTICHQPHPTPARLLGRSARDSGNESVQCNSCGTSWSDRRILLTTRCAGPYRWRSGGPTVGHEHEPLLLLGLYKGVRTVPFSSCVFRNRSPRHVLRRPYCYMTGPKIVAILSPIRRGSALCMTEDGEISLESASQVS